MEDKDKIIDQMNGELIKLRRRVSNLENTEKELEKLKEIREQFARAFLDNPTPMVISTIAEGRYIEANDAFLALIGLERKEVIGHTYAEIGFLTKEQRSMLLKELESRGRFENFEMQAVTKGGELKYGLLNFSIINYSGQDCLLTVVTDITKRKHAEDALRESEEKHRILLEESSDPIFSFTAEGRYTFVNKAFAKGVNKQIDEIIGKTMWEVFPKDEADKRFAALSYVFKHGREKMIEARVPLPVGDQYYLTTITPIKSQEGKVISAICSSKNITERKLKEETIRENERRYRYLVENSSDIIFTTNIRGIFTYVNPSAERLTGYAISEVVGKHYHFLARQDYHKQIDNLYAKQLLDKTMTTYSEFPIITSDGSEKWVGQQVQLIFEQNEVVGFQAVVRDITDRLKAEEDHRQREKLSAILETAGMVCHEMNQPMQTILGQTDMILLTMKDEAVSKRLQIIKEQLERMRNITGKLMNITRHKTKPYVGEVRIIDLDKSSD